MSSQIFLLTLTQSESNDDEFLASRVLFLTTYDANLDYPQLVRENHLADNINAAIARHAKRYSRTARRKSQEHTQPMELMALSETLKLLFNITHFHPDLAEHFSKSIPNICKMLVRRGIPQPPLTAPVNYLINALLNLDLEDTKGQQKHCFGQNAVFPLFDQKCNAEHLITILDKSIVAYPEAELDNTIAPVLTLIRRIYEIAPESVKKYMERAILPTPEERDKPLGKSDTLPSRLLNLSTSALTPNLRGSISSMLFELSNKDASTFVQNVGYGFASGFLMSNNIPMPENAMQAHATAQVEQGIPVNPITGQRLDREEGREEEPMTQEEKEREAERLFVLFERYVIHTDTIRKVKGKLTCALDSKRRVLWMCRIRLKRRIALGGLRSCRMIRIERAMCFRLLCVWSCFHSGLELFERGTMSEHQHRLRGFGQSMSRLVRDITLVTIGTPR